MDSDNFTENLIVPLLVVVFALFCWGALQATCAVVAKIEPEKVHSVALRGR